jgi:hypothetical protein
MSVSKNISPSALVWCSGLQPSIQVLLEASRKFRSLGNFPKAEQCAMDVRKATRYASERIGYGSAALHLADIYREKGKLGPAHTQYEQAQQIFNHQSDRVQRQNEAAATLGLGLTYQALGDPLEALNWYQVSLDLLDRACKYWAELNEEKRLQFCEQVCQWIRDEQIGAILEERLGSFPPMPIDVTWRVGGAKNPFGKVSLRARITTDYVVINENVYQIHPLLKQQDISTIGSVDSESFILRVSKDGWGVPEAKTDDLLLVHQKQVIQEEKVGVVWESDDGWIAGDFKRGSGGKIQFIPHSRQPKIIGGQLDNREKGYVVAVLKPTSSAQQPSVSPSPPPPQPSVPPSSGPSYDPKELFNELLSMVNGDKEVAQRLVDYEQERAPSADSSELIQRAIDRLIRDRR